MAQIGQDRNLPQIALDSVKIYLDTPYGIVLLNPAYSRYYLNLGEVSTYPPGYKENAGVFCHNNPWIMIAEAILGRGDQAFEYYRKICPAYLEALSDLHRTEPYVYSQMIAGKDAKRHGEAKNSWLTGTAAWNFIAISQWILGIQPTIRACALTRAFRPIGSNSRSNAFFEAVSTRSRLTILSASVKGSNRSAWMAKVCPAILRRFLTMARSMLWKLRLDHKNRALRLSLNESDAFVITPSDGRTRSSENCESIYRSYRQDCRTTCMSQRIRPTPVPAANEPAVVTFNPPVWPALWKSSTMRR